MRTKSLTGLIVWTIVRFIIFSVIMCAILCYCKTEDVLIKSLIFGTVCVLIWEYKSTGTKVDENQTYEVSGEATTLWEEELKRSKKRRESAKHMYDTPYDDDNHFDEGHDTIDGWCDECEDKLDHLIKEQLHIKGYIRYNDDFILLHPDRQYLVYCHDRIEKELTEIGLELSSRKTQSFPITQAVHFLGFSFRLTETGKIIRKILPENVTHERRKLKRLIGKVNEGIITKSEVDESYRSWKAHIEKGNNHNVILRMDAYYKKLWEVNKNEVSITEGTATRGKA